MTSEQASAAIERFNNKILFHEDGCWYYTGRLDSDGYGMFWFIDETRRAHRVSYELLVGPIPEGYALDHICHDPALCLGGNLCPHRKCVNPDHLMPVLFGENTSTGRRVTKLTPDGLAARRAHRLTQSEYCVNGHLYTPETTKPRSNGGRLCRICLRATVRRSRLRRLGVSA